MRKRGDFEKSVDSVSYEDKSQECCTCGKHFGLGSSDPYWRAACYKRWQLGALSQSENFTLQMRNYLNTFEHAHGEVLPADYSFLTGKKSQFYEPKDRIFTPHPEFDKGVTKEAMIFRLRQMDMFNNRRMIAQ